jgi:hypothetical protein
MPVLCISLPRPGPRLRAVIVIVIYLAAVKIAPADTLPLAAGGALGGFLAIEPARPRAAAVSAELGR